MFAILQMSSGDGQELTQIPLANQRFLGLVSSKGSSQYRRSAGHRAGSVWVALDYQGKSHEQMTGTQASLQMSSAGKDVVCEQKHK